MNDVHAVTVKKLKSSRALFNNQLVSFADAHLSIASSPILYGLAVYTVCLARPLHTGTVALFRLRDHYRRLCESAKILGLGDIEQSMPYHQFAEQLTQLVLANKLTEDSLVRMTLYVDELIAGTKMHGLASNFCAYVYAANEFLPSSGAHLAVSSWRRTPDVCIPSRAKINGSYVNASLAKNQALLDGYDDAILLDTDGHVTESTVANIFLVKNNRLITPPVSSDLLEGITRDTVIRLANSLELGVEQRQIDRTELYIADEIFLCGSSARVVPVISVDRIAVGGSKKGDITQRIADGYNRITGGELVLDVNWLTLINEKAAT